MSSEKTQGIDRAESSGEAPTLAQRLRQGMTDVLKDLVGLSSRLITYGGSAVVGEIGAAAVGLDRGTSIAVGFSVMAINMTAGESYYMRRLARVLPLVRADRSGWWDNKRNN